MANVLVQPPAPIAEMHEQHVLSATFSDHSIDLTQVPIDSVTVYKSCAAVFRKFLVPIEATQDPSRSRKVWIHIVNFPRALITDSPHIRGFGDRSISIEETVGTTVQIKDPEVPVSDALQRQLSVVSFLSNEKRKLEQWCEQLRKRREFLKEMIMGCAVYKLVPKEQNALYTEERSDDEDDPLAPSDDEQEEEKINSHTLFTELLGQPALDSCSAFVQQYEQEQQSLFKQLAETEAKLEHTEEELQCAMKRKAELTQPPPVTRNVFRYSVLVHIPSVIANATTLDFELFYLVSDCKWVAFYDLNVSLLSEAQNVVDPQEQGEVPRRAANKKQPQMPNVSSQRQPSRNPPAPQPKLSKYPTKSNASLAYYANISQQTGEHWNQVRLYLCTIDPQFVMKAPSSISSLPVQFVNFSVRSKGWSVINWFASIVGLDNQGVRNVVGAVAQEQPAQDEEKSTAEMYLFKIGQLYSVPSDKQQHKICMETKIDLFSRFQHVAIPRNSNGEIFVKMTALNPLAKQPLLKGKVNVFQEGNFTCASNLERDVNCGEKFSLFLGQDNLNFKIDYLVERSEKSSTYNKRSIKVRRIITITRKNESVIGKSSIILLRDLIPKSTDAGIQVSLMEPAEVKPLYDFVSSPNSVPSQEMQGRADPFTMTRVGLGNDVILEPTPTALQKFLVKKVHLSPEQIISFKFSMGEYKKICLKLVYSVSFHPQVTIDTTSL